MNTIIFPFPIPKQLKAYFKDEFLHLLDSYAAHDKLFHVKCKSLKDPVDAIGWSLDRHLVWFLSHFSVLPEDYEYCYVDALISKPGWRSDYDTHWEEWLEKLVAPTDDDLDACMDAEEFEYE